MTQPDRKAPDPELGNVVEEEEARWILEQQQLGPTEVDAPTEHRRIDPLPSQSPPGG